MTDRETIEKALRAAMDRLTPEDRAALRVGSIPVRDGTWFLIDADAPMHEKMEFVDFVHKRVLQ